MKQYLLCVIILSIFLLLSCEDDCIECPETEETITGDVAVPLSVGNIWYFSGLDSLGNTVYRTDSIVGNRTILGEQWFLMNTVVSSILYTIYKDSIPVFNLNGSYYRTAVRVFVNSCVNLFFKQRPFLFSSV